jgi:hypothetical protein
MEHTSCQERLQWYYEHDQPRVKAMQKKCEEYERTFWDVSKKVAEGEEQDALFKLLQDFKFDYHARARVCWDGMPGRTPPQFAPRDARVCPAPSTT